MDSILLYSITFLDKPAVSRNSWALKEPGRGRGLEFLRGLIFILAAAVILLKKPQQGGIK
jgi:hypothetical protein